MKEGKMGFQSPESVVIPAVYDYIYSPYGKCILAKKEGKIGAVDGQNKTLIPFEYQACGALDLFPLQRPWRDTAEVTLDAYRCVLQDKTGNWGVLNGEHKTIIPFEYQQIQRIYQTYFAYRKNDFDVYNLSGTLIGGPYFRKKSPNLVDAMVVVRQNEGLSWIDTKNGHWNDKPLYQRLDDKLTKYYIATNSDYKMGLIEKATGAVVIPCRYTFLESSHPGYFGVNNGIKTGVIDIKGDTVVPFLYEVVQNSGLAFPYVKVMQQQKWGVLNLDTEKTTIEPHYESLRAFNQHLAFQKEGKWGVVGLEDQLLLAPEYGAVQAISTTSNAILVINSEVQYGYFNNGALRIPCAYDEIKATAVPGMIGVKKGNAWAIYDTLGQALTGFEFETLYHQQPIAKRKDGQIVCLGLKNTLGAYDWATTFDEVQYIPVEGYIVKKKIKGVDMFSFLFKGQMVAPLEFTKVEVVTINDPSIRPYVDQYENLQFEDGAIKAWKADGSTYLFRVGDKPLGLE